MRVFNTADNVMSYAMARMKADRLHFGERESDADPKAKVARAVIITNTSSKAECGCASLSCSRLSVTATLIGWQGKAEYQHSVAAPTVEFATLRFRRQESVEPTTCPLASRRRGLSKTTAMRAISEPTRNSDAKRKAHS